MSKIIPPAIASALTRHLPRVVKSKLLQQSGFYLVGQFLQKAVSFLLIPVWTLYLTPSDYGIMGTLSAYGGILHILLMFGIYGAVTRHYFDFKNDPETQRSYVTSNFLFLAVVSGTVLSGLILFGQPLWARITSNSIAFYPYVVLMLISCYGGLIARLPYSLYQAQQRAQKCVTIDFGTFVLSVGISLIFVVGLRKGVYGMMMGGFIAQSVIALVTTGLLLREWFSPRPEWRHVASSLRFGLPFVPHLLCGWALTFVDRVMLERMVPLEEVGRYNLAYSLGMVMMMLVSSIKDAYEPYYYNLLLTVAEPGKKIVRIFSLYVTVVGSIALFGSLFAEDFIILLTPPRYHGSASYVAPVLLGYLFLGYYFNVGMAIFYYKKTRVLPLVTGAAAIVNIALNYFLIPKFGAIAAAWNTYVCYALIGITYYIIAQRVRSFPYPILTIAVLSGIILLFVLVARSIPSLTLIGTLQKLGLCAAYLGASYLLLLRDSGAKSQNG